MKYKVAEPVEFGTTVLGTTGNSEVRGQSAHQLRVVEDLGYLLACHWSLQRDCVPAACVIIEVNPDALDCQDFTRSERV